MKKISNQKGFALIETLVVATFVLTIFMLLIANYYPMMGKLERTSNYDETENIYIAYHTISLMKKNSKLLDKQLESLTNSDITTQNLPICTKNSSNKCIFIEFTASELCERFTTNKEQCTQFTNTTNINRVFITNYATKDLKEKLKNMNVSRALELYVKYIPSHEHTKSEKESKFDRIIIERKLHDHKSDTDIFKYANYEISAKGE